MEILGIIILFVLIYAYGPVILTFILIFAAIFIIKKIVENREERKLLEEQRLYEEAQSKWYEKQRVISEQRRKLFKEILGELHLKNLNMLIREYDDQIIVKSAQDLKYYSDLVYIGESNALENIRTALVEKREIVDSLNTFLKENGYKAKPQYDYIEKQLIDYTNKPITYKVKYNPNGGTGGRNIEEDSEYRERIRSWSSGLNIGTRQCIDNYLGMYDGLDSYRLVPLYDGVGTLKIVCDTLPTLLDSISSDVYENCMLVTDYPPLCVLPESTTLSTLELTVSKGDGVTGYTDDELKQLVVAQVETFVNGGVKRDSTRMSGLGIGDDFIPSQLVQYLLGEFPELVNIVPDSMEVITVPDTNHFNIEQTEVVIE